MYPFFIGEEYDPTARNEANKYNSILQESTNLEEVLLHSQFNSFVESRAIQFDKFLKKEGIIEGLLKLLVTSDDKLLVNAAAKVFTSKFMYVRSTTVNSDQLLNILFSELLDVATSDIQHNPDNNYQISSVMSTLLSAHKWEMVEYITNKISNDKIHLILNYPHFLLTLLDYNICTTAIKLTQWIIKTELVNLLIDTFINGNTLYEEASEALVQLTSFDSKIRESISEDSVRLFLTSLHMPPNDKVDKKWFVSQILSILSNLITTSQLQGGLSDVSESLEPIIDHIPQFITYLESDPLSVSIQNTVGEVAPFGMARMEVVNILSNLLQLDQHNYKITKILLDSNILQIFINLIIQYPWNNILHTKVVEIIDTILSSNFGFETDILTQTNIHDVVAKNLLECHRVLSERNEILPYTSIFEKIASLLTQYSDSVISDSLYDSEIWAEYRRVVHGENYDYSDYRAMRTEFENQEKANKDRGDGGDDDMNENGNIDEGNDDDDGNDESNQNDNVNGDNDCVDDSNNESGDNMNNEEKSEF